MNTEHYRGLASVRWWVALGVFLVAPRAEAGSGTASLVKANTINEFVPGNNLGACGLFVVFTAGSHSLYPLVQFSIPTGINAGRITVTSVSLGFGTIAGMPGFATPTAPIGYFLEKVGSAWGAGGKGCGSASPNWVNGAACTAGEVTWGSPNCSGTTWVGGSLSGSAASNVGSSPSWSGCPGTICSDVQGWIASSGTNFGWAVVGSWAGGAVNRGIRVSAPGSFTYAYSCSGQYKEVFTGGNPNTNCTTCTDAANTACQTVSGNGCVDSGPPSTTYSCNCNVSGWKAGSGNTSCVPACVVNVTCRENGDSGAGCNDNATGFTCACSAGFVANGSSCVVGCNNSNPAPQPCGNGGTCNTSDGGNSWTCACTTGYKSDQQTRAKCIEFQGCSDGAGNVQCVTSQGNGCADRAAPSLLWTCACSNPAYAPNPAVNPTQCVDKNECSPDHCVTGGDSGAVCSDHIAPQTGYDCTCSTPQWTHGLVGGFTSCVDKDECASPSPFPCLNGACTNVTGGGGYSCTCAPGYVSTTGKTPTCVHPDACNDNSAVSCVTAQKGNRCVDNPPPQIGFTCDCKNPAYALSIDGRSCVDKNACADDHCGDLGDRGANCVDRQAPIAGYDCECSPGWTFDGITCVDVDECVGGANPCGHGTCSNTKGSFQCTCSLGFVLKNGVCVAGGASGNLIVTTSPGSGCGCRIGSRAPGSSAPILLLVGVVLLLRRRFRSTS